MGCDNQLTIFLWRDRLWEPTVVLFVWRVPMGYILVGTRVCWLLPLVAHARQMSVRADRFCSTLLPYLFRSDAGIKSSINSNLTAALPQFFCLRRFCQHNAFMSLTHPRHRALLPSFPQLGTTYHHDADDANRPPSTQPVRPRHKRNRGRGIYRRQFCLLRSWVRNTI